uniref:Uncharacterized protein n=1 Tax=Sipha flava TaxID=143950 RepID=A0A2S2QLM6_9HEMI
MFSSLFGYISLFFQVMLSVSQKFKKFGCFHFIVVTLRNFIVILVSGGHRLHGERRRHHLVRLLLSVFACTQPNLIRLQPFRQNHVFCARVNFITCLGGHLPTAIVQNVVSLCLFFVSTVDFVGDYSAKLYLTF